jgi:serine/threonine protein kinase
LVKNGIYKIADFGFGRLVDNLDDETVKTILGSPVYSSPQILQFKPYSSKCDIWSLGILLFQMLYFKTPFDVKSTQ